METELERVLMSCYKDEMISWLLAHPEKFEEAIVLATGNKQPYAWRSAWLLWSCMQDNDSRIIPRVSIILQSLAGKKDGHQRELIKILSRMEINEALEGLLFDHCMTIWEAVVKRPSVRYHAFQMMLKIAEKYPELLNEIVCMTEDHYTESLSPGIKHSLMKQIAGLKKQMKLG